MSARQLCGLSTVSAAQAVNQPVFGLNGTAMAVRNALLVGLALAAVPVQAADAPLADSAAASRDVPTLSSVTVQGRTEAVLPAYAGGQVATGGRVGLLGDKDFMETPFSTVSYTEEFIQNRQARDISDVIAATDPTVFNSGVAGQNLESFSIRGFASNIGDVTVGGLAGMAPYYRSSPEMFERIEVLKGPSALLNGMPPKGSVGGAVNLVPKRAGDDPLLRLTTTYMSDSEFGGHIDMGRRFGENKQFGIRVNGVYRDGESAVRDQKKKVQLASVGMDWRAERVRLSADLYHSKERVDGPTRGITLAPGLELPAPPSPDTLLNPSWAFNDVKDQGAMLRGEFDINERWMAYAAAGTSRTDFASQSSAVAQVFNSAGDYRTNLGDVSDKVKRKSGEVGVQGQFQTGPVGHRLAMNVTHYKEDYQLNARRGVLSKDWVTNLYDPVWGPRPSLFNPQPINRSETRLTSYGLADTLSFADERVQLTLGLRRQNVVTESFHGVTGKRMGQRYDQSATTPAAALLIKATDELSVYANYIEGLSQGAIAPTTALNAGEVFAPFKTRQKEVGLKFDLGQFAHTVSLFEIKRPSSYLDPASAIFSFGGEQRNRGIEWTFFGSSMENVRLMGGIAYIDAKMTQTAGGVNQGRQATGIPKWQAKAGVEWDTPWARGLTLTANATTVSRQYINADNSLAAPGRTLFDVGARYAATVAGRPVTVRASVLNLTNKAYWAKPHYTSLGLGAPRTFMLSASMDF
ncbi:TonB-dependent siderophore receptor [Alcaligenes sp. SDU_A2]|uniref:TonB-dependent receptor n=2 Tax=Alcaligenes sp. SDU_A2 TaxID=3136634 RepID=UPI00311F306A